MALGLDAISLGCTHDPTAEQRCRDPLGPTKYPRKVYVLADKSVTCELVMGSYDGSRRACYRGCARVDTPNPFAFEGCTAECHREIGAIPH